MSFQGKTGVRSGDVFVFYREFCFLYISSFTISTFGSFMYRFLGSVQDWRQRYLLAAIRIT